MVKAPLALIFSLCIACVACVATGAQAQQNQKKSEATKPARPCCLSSSARAWCHAAVARLAQTLGVRRQHASRRTHPGFCIAVRRESHVSRCAIETLKPRPSSRPHKRAAATRLHNPVCFTGRRRAAARVWPAVEVVLVAQGIAARPFRFGNHHRHQPASHMCAGRLP